jgi:N utilization substance protein A
MARKSISLNGLNELTVFAARALTPAKVNEVRVVDAERRLMEAIVSADQLSLALGKRGMNIRLANELVGGRIDIRSENESEVSETPS